MGSHAYAQIETALGRPQSCDIHHTANLMLPCRKHQRFRCLVNKNPICVPTDSLRSQRPRVHIQLVIGWPWFTMVDTWTPAPVCTSAGLSSLRNFLVVVSPLEASSELKIRFSPSTKVPGFPCPLMVTCFRAFPSFTKSGSSFTWRWKPMESCALKTTMNWDI